MKKCKNCNKDYPDDKKFCKKCGEQLIEIEEFDFEEATQKVSIDSSQWYKRNMKNIVGIIMLVLIPFAAYYFILHNQIKGETEKSAIEEPINYVQEPSQISNNTYIDDSDLTSNYAKIFIGTWSNDGYPIIEITYKNGKFRIRQCYGKDASEGIEFWGTYKNKKIIASGNARDFYKFELPTFQVLQRDIIHYECGAGPFDLKKSIIKMPKAKFSQSLNKD